MSHRRLGDPFLPQTNLVGRPLDANATFGRQLRPDCHALTPHSKRTSVTLLCQCPQATRRCAIHRRNFLHVKKAALKVQATRRGSVERRRYLRARKAVTTIQAGARAWRAEKEYRQIRQATQRFQVGLAADAIYQREGLQHLPTSRQFE